jgi:F-type H+-transporting ATPase subunit gamma
MTARRELQRRLASLAEIRSIMNSMKALAFMETRKLDRLMASQRAMVATIDGAARDLLRYHPDLLPVQGPVPTLQLLIGSQRGFCGDFNEALQKTVTDTPAAGVQALPKDRILVGRRLRLRVADETRLCAALDGPDVAEDVDRVLREIVAVISRVQAERGVIGVVARYHGPGDGMPLVRPLLPPWQEPPSSGDGRTVPPVLNVPPRDMFRALVEHYLLAALHEILLTSLWAENMRRARHLEGAVKRLDERIEALASRSQQLRQEEIIEEIEVILLNETGPQAKHAGLVQGPFADGPGGEPSNPRNST